MQDTQVVTSLVTDPLLTQLTVSSVVVWIIKKVKEASWFPWLSEATARNAQMAWGLVAAVITGLGIQYTFDAASGSLVVTGLTLAGMGSALWAAAQSFVVQQLVYHGVVKPAAPTAAGG